MDKKSNDADAQKNLDVEFRRILRIIKPYIPCVMNNDYLTFYRLWLEKLNDTERSEKHERNRYLIELCYQIQDGILEHPFTQLPIPGPLAPFKNKFQSSKVQLHEQHLSNFNSADKNVPKLPNSPNQKIINSARKPETPQAETIYENSAEVEPNDQAIANSESMKVILKSPIARKLHKRRNQHTVSNDASSPPILNQNVLGDFSLRPPMYPINAFSSKLHFQQGEVFGMNPGYLPRPQPQQQNPINNNYLHMLQNLSPRITQARASQQKMLNLSAPVNNDDDDESSWFDLSEASHTTMVTKLASADSDTLPTARTETNTVDKTYEMYESRIVDLMRTVTSLQKQNLSLNEDVAKYERDLTLRNTRADTSIHNLACEVNSLKTRLQELTDIKMAVNNSQLASTSQWENTANSLSKELQMTQTNNAELKAEIAVLQKRLEDFSSQRQKDSTTLRQKLSEMHNKEIEMLKQNHAMHIADTENRFAQKLNELQEQYERKISNVNEEHRRISKEKDSEIKRLDLMINTQCKQMHDEVSRMRTQVDGNSSMNVNEENFDKVVLLQKCVARMDKLFKKSEKHFAKQIAKLKHEIDLRDKIIQIQLSAQRAELLSNTNVDRQHEVDATVVQLEERYKKLLDAQQAHFLSEKREDCRLIAELRSVIARNNTGN